MRVVSVSVSISVPVSVSVSASASVSVSVSISISVSVFSLSHQHENISRASHCRMWPCVRTMLCQMYLYVRIYIYHADTPGV